MEANQIIAIGRLGYISGAFTAFLLLAPAYAEPAADVQAIIASFDAKDKTQCPDARTPAGIPYCTFFGAFSHNRKLPDFKKRLAKLIAMQEANPEDATLLYLRLWMDSGALDGRNSDKIKPLAEMARQAHDRPLAAIIELLRWQITIDALVESFRTNNASITQEEIDKNYQHVIEVIAQIDEAAKSFPDDGQRLYFRARTRLAASNFMGWLQTANRHRASKTPLPTGETYAEEAVQYLKLRYEADRNNPAKLEDHRHEVMYHGSWEALVTPETIEKLLPLDEELARLKPDDPNAHLQLLASYLSHATNVIAQGDLATAKADIARIEKLLADRNFSHPDRFSERLHLIKIMLLAEEQPARAGKPALQELRTVVHSDGWQQQTLVNIIAKSIISLKKNGHRKQADALYNKTLEEFSHSDLNTPGLFFSWLQGYALKSSLAKEAEAFHWHELQWLHEGPIGINFSHYFATAKYIIKTEAMSMAKRRKLVGMTLTYVSDKRLRAVNSVFSRAYPGEPLRQISLIIADELREFRKVLYDARASDEASPLFRRETELRARYLPEP